MKISKEDSLDDLYRFWSQRSIMTLNSNKLQSPLGAQDCYPQATSHVYVTDMVITQLGLNSDPHYFLPFVVHASPETGIRLIVVSSRISLIQYKGYSPSVPRKSRLVLPIKKLNKLNYFQELAN